MPIQFHIEKVKIERGADRLKDRSRKIHVNLILILN